VCTAQSREAESVCTAQYREAESVCTAQYREAESVCAAQCREIKCVFISVINQLDVKNFCFTISLFYASTCFEHMCSSSGGQNCITPIGVMIPDAV